MSTRSRGVGRIGTGVVLLVLALGGPALAQYQPAPAVKAERHCTKKQQFELPIVIADKDRAAVREVQLYVKEPGGVWVKKDTAPPTQSLFKYLAPRDGEYWFSVVTVDLQGRPNPADVTRQPPDLVVVVDTVPPVVDVTVTSLPDGQAGLRCLIKDDNADYQKLQVAYQAAGQSWQNLEPVPGQAGMFRLPAGTAPNGIVRWTTEDKARNKNSQDVVFSAQGTPGPAQLPTAAAPTAPGLPPAPPALLTKTPGGMDLSPVVPQPPPLPPSQAQAKAPAGGQDVIPTSNFAAPGQPGSAGTPGHGQFNHSGFKTGGEPSPSPYAAPPANAVPPLQKVAAVAATSNRQLINSQFASIDYRLDKIGPSGVSKVEVWMKAETAATWQRLAVDADHKTPATVQFPHDGLFGIRLTVTNGNGFGGAPPQPNDSPAYLIEVDTTPPFAQLQPVGPVTGDVIDIRWTATDKNMGPEPVNLYYATERGGQWQVIARGVPNTGQFGWHIPRNIGSQFYVRLEVSDEVGNVSRSETTSPVQLDLSEPQAQVVGVTGVAGKN